MGGSCGGNEDSFGTAVLHQVVWIRKELDRRWKVGGGPFGGTGLGVAGGDELDARLLECEDTGTNSTQTAEADQADLETTLSGHLVIVVVV